MDQFLGIIDLGSNSARLVIYAQSAGGMLFEVDNIKRVLRLSAHLNAQGRMEEAGVRLTLDCMRSFKQLCEARGVTEIVGVATAAIRQATNGRQIVARIFEETGIVCTVLSGEQEAYYGYLAVANSTNYREAYTVDIGGGSTEVTYMRDRQLLERISFPFGAVTLTRRFFKQDTPRPEELRALEQFLHEQLAAVPWICQRGVPLIALGGGARNVANMHQKKHKYPFSSIHQYTMSDEAVQDTFRTLAKTPLDKRRKLKGLSPDRADIIVAATGVFHSLCKLTGAREFVVSTKGLRDGVLFERTLRGLGQESALIPDVPLFSARQWMERYQINRTSAEHVSELAVGLYDQLLAAGLLPERGERQLLRMAALLYDAGLTINVYDTRQHTFYLLSNVLLMGLTHRERLLTALIASYKTDKKLEKMMAPYKGLIEPEEKERIKRLGLILWLCRTLDRSLTQAVKRVELRRAGDGYVLFCAGVRKDLVEYTLLKEIIDQFTSSYQREIQFQSVEEGEDGRS